MMLAGLSTRLVRAVLAVLALALADGLARAQAERVGGGPGGGTDVAAALAVTVGDSLQTLATRLKGRLEPDLCDSEAYARSLGWSCEGYQARGLSAAGVPMRARFSLDASGVVVRSIVVTLDTSSDAAGRSDDRSEIRSDATVVRACGHLMRSIRALYTDAGGAGPQAQGATRLVQHYHSRDRRSIATLLCAKGAGGTSGEVALVIDPFDSAQPAGLRSAADGLLSADDQLQRCQGIAGERRRQSPVALPLGQVLAQEVTPGRVYLRQVRVIGLPRAAAFG